MDTNRRLALYGALVIISVSLIPLNMGFFLYALGTPGPVNEGFLMLTGAIDFTALLAAFFLQSVLRRDERWYLERVRAEQERAAVRAEDDWLRWFIAHLSVIASTAGWMGSLRFEPAKLSEGAAIAYCRTAAIKPHYRSRPVSGKTDSPEAYVVLFAPRAFVTDGQVHGLAVLVKPVSAQPLCRLLLPRATSSRIRWDGLPSVLHNVPIEAIEEGNEFTLSLREYSIRFKLSSVAMDGPGIERITLQYSAGGW